MKPFRRKKGGRRERRVASVVREIVSRVLVTELSDPRMGLVTVTGVDVSADLRIADVRVSVLGEPKAQRQCMEAIAHSRGHIQERVADSVDMKFCPVLKFHLDDSVKKSVAVSALIARARAEDERARADRIRRGVESPDNDDDAEVSTDDG